MQHTRRGFIAGILAAAAAPAIIRTPGLIMPIKPKLVGDTLTLERLAPGIYDAQIQDVFFDGKVARYHIRMLNNIRYGKFGTFTFAQAS